MDEAVVAAVGGRRTTCRAADSGVAHRAGPTGGERTLVDDPIGRSGDVAIGFLTAVDSPTHGVFGGYLIVDLSGRPVEFHCTAPIKVSRAQQILYGTTLSSHLHGRQIGAALLAEGTLEPRVVLTDLESMLHVRPHTTLPVALVSRATDADATGADTNDRDDRCFPFGGARVGPVPAEHAGMPVFREQLAELAAAVDLHEPFERIRAAIEEAQRH